MKKLFFLIATFGFLLSLTACGSACEHKYDNDCDAICNICEEERQVQEHQWIDATCTTPKTCKDCGHTEGETLGHNLVHHELIDPSCTEDGTIEYWYCTKCETKFSDEDGTYSISDAELYIEAHGHSIVYSEYTGESCDSEGLEEHWYCNLCGTYFTDEDGTQIIEFEELVISKKEHIDLNEDYICDHGCGEVLLQKDNIQQIIGNTLTSTKVTVKEKYVPGATDVLYYFDENLLYILDNRFGDEKYYYTEEETTYLLTKEGEWSKEIVTEEINYNLSYLLEKFNFDISNELSLYKCNYGIFNGETMFEYTNSSETKVLIKLNVDYTLLEGLYICDEYNNIIYMYEIIYGENEEISNTLEDINNFIDGYKYNETTNIYNVYSSQGILDAVDLAEVSGTTENPAIIKLMNDIAIEAVVDEQSGLIIYAILIESGNIIIDLYGHELSATNNPNSIIQIGNEWGQVCNAIVTIQDSSTTQNGKIYAPYIGINSLGGTLIFNSGTIEVNNTIGDWVAIGIEFYLGSVTMNGGSILVNNVTDSWQSSGVREAGEGGTFTMNEGYISATAEGAIALYLRKTACINGGTITTNGDHIWSSDIINLGTNESSIGATFIGGIKSSKTLNSILKLTDGVGYYDTNGNLIEVSDDIKEITEKGDITVKKIIE